jgi:ribonuclease J
MPTPEEPVKAADGRRRRRTTAAPVASWRARDYTLDI